LKLPKFLFAIVFAIANRKMLAIDRSVNTWMWWDVEQERKPELPS